MTLTETPVGYEHGTVAEAMTPGVITCPPETPLRAVAQTMAHHRVHSIVVHESGGDDPWAVISDLDLITGALSGFDETTAGAAAASPPLTVAPLESLANAGQLMRENATSHLLVVDEHHGRPVGILSTLDLAHAIASDTPRNGRR